MTKDRKPNPPYHLRLPDSLREDLLKKAQGAHRTGNAHINLLLKQSIEDFPTLESAPEVTESYGQSPFGLRLDSDLKKALESAAKKKSRSLNTEIVMRLNLAVFAGLDYEEPLSKTVGLDLSPKASFLPGLSDEENAAWLKLTSAIENLISAPVGNAEPAAKALVNARSRYEMIRRQLAIKIS